MVTRSTSGGEFLSSISLMTILSTNNLQCEIVGMIEHVCCDELAIKGSETCTV